MTPKTPDYMGNHLSNRDSRAHEVYFALKEDIVWGRIEPGTLLSETRIAQAFSVSRTPVREALHKLAADGVLQSVPNQGHLVHTVSVSEALDAFRLREILEVEAAGQAANRITETQLKRLRELADTRQSDDFIAINREFHTIIARASGNRILADYIDRLLVLMQQVLALDPHLSEWMEDGAQEEFDIVDALAAGDEVAARTAMRRHVRSAKAAVLQQMEPSRFPSSEPSR